LPGPRRGPIALADAARKAKAQSNAVSTSGHASKNLSPSAVDGDLQEVPLTHAVIDRYAAARLAVGRAFHRDIDLFNRVDERIRAVRRTRQAAEIYAVEPVLKKAIEFNGFTVAEFIDVMLTIQRANVRAHRAKPGIQSPLQMANTNFMREHAVALCVLDEELSSKSAWQLPVPSYFLRH
jgi:hypothetical protein